MDTPQDYKVKIEKNGIAKGKVIFNTPPRINSGKLTIRAMNNPEKSASATILLQEKGAIRMVQKSYRLYSDGGKVVIDYDANINCTVEIPVEARSWISEESPNLRAISKKSVLLNVSANKGTDERRTNLKLVDPEGKAPEVTFHVVQNGSTPTVTYHVSTTTPIVQLPNRDHIITKPYIAKSDTPCHGVF